MKKKDKQSDIVEIRKKIASNECSLYSRFVKNPIYNKNGEVKRKDGKIETELLKDHCAFGHTCRYFENLECPNFSNEIIEEYLKQKEKIDEKQEKSRHRI